MASKLLFKGNKGPLLPVARAFNEAGSPAYAYSPKQQLAQYAATGCLSHTYYADAETQLRTLLTLAADVEPEFVAKTAIYCRRHGQMKDTPALLASFLAKQGTEYLPAVFGEVIDNGRMLRNFVQILRSGVVGRKSLGSRPKKLVQAWLNNASEAALLRAAVGTEPSLADVVKMVHPKPNEAWREAFFAWLVGRPYEEAALPPLTRAFEAYKRDRTLPIPDVPFQLLTALEPGREEWTAIALNAHWQMLRMNLNTFTRHGVFETPGTSARIAARLADAAAVRRARVFPYQLLTAWKSLHPSVPAEIRDALQDAMEVALENVPPLAARVVVCPDVSGSMQSAVTGHRKGSTTTTRCIDVAALVTAALVRQNPQTRVLPFENKVVPIALNPRDTVLTNAGKLAAIGGGGTNCSAPLALLNQERAQADLVILASDNQSWVDGRPGATETMRQWAEFRGRNPRAKLVCVDLQPYGHSQAAEREDILNIGGFSDAVFTMIHRYAQNELDPDHWVGEIEKVVLPSAQAAA